MYLTKKKTKKKHPTLNLSFKTLFYHMWSYNNRHQSTSYQYNSIKLEKIDVYLEFYLNLLKILVSMDLYTDFTECNHMKQQFLKKKY